MDTWPLAATSWLWPATLEENLRRIARWELPIRQTALLFYQHAPSLAYTPQDIPALPGLSSHVHLPLDLPWASGPRAVWDIVRSLMEGTAAPLSPWCGVLHPPAAPGDLAGLATLWRKCAPGWKLLVENIPGQDLHAHWPVIKDLDIPVCLDVGHLMAFGQDWLLSMPDLARRVELVHCYAPGDSFGSHEHLPLTRLTRGQKTTLRAVFAQLAPTTVILFEVFAESDLRASLQTFYALKRKWRMTA